MSITFVDPDHADILRKYLNKRGVVLIFPEAQAAAQACGLNDGDDTPEDYDFGGDPDVSVEKVSSPQHYLFMCVGEQTEGDDE